MNRPVAEALATSAQCRRITPAGEHFFFGYYDKCPWDTTQQRLLAARAPFMDRRPTADDGLELGIIDLSTEQFQHFGTTRAWNWQQGCMMQWLDDRQVIYNDRRDGRFVSVIHDTITGKSRMLDRPIYALCPTAPFALSLSFARLATVRPGYGYAGVADPFVNDMRPSEEGIYHLNLLTGQSQRIISVAQVAAAVSMNSEGADAPAKHWFNHIQFAPDGSRFAFLHRWGRPRPGGGAWWTTRLMSAKPDGSDLICLSDHGMVSHYDWFDGQRLCAWAFRQGIGNRYFMFDVRQPERVEIIGTGVFDCDGHCSFSPDRRGMITDTYPDAQGYRRLLLWHMQQQQLTELGRYYGPFPDDHETRCDLHPRWSRDGKSICIDSAHEGYRGMYVLPLP